MGGGGDVKISSYGQDWQQHMLNYKAALQIFQIFERKLPNVQT